MKRDLVVLDNDKYYIIRRIAELEAQIQDLGPEFRDVFSQSSETWHDNAPFDALRDRQSLLDAELQSLRRILRDSTPSVPKGSTGTAWYGSTVELANGKRFFIAGDWTMNAGQRVRDAVVVSAQSPVALQLIKKRVGDSVVVGTMKTKIMAIL